MVEFFFKFFSKKVPDIKTIAPNNVINNAMYTNNNHAHPSIQNAPQQQQIANSVANNNNNMSGGTQLSLQQLQQFPQIKPDEINKVLDDVNIIKTKQKMVDDSLFNVKK